MSRSIVTSRPTRRVPPIPRRHLIVKWDQTVKRYICDCGERSKTATDHEVHASIQQKAVG